MLGCVWGGFAFMRAITERPPWFLKQCIAVLAYGYSFSMGFMNYHLSLGLACFGLAILWRGKGIDWIGGMAGAAMTLFADPIGLFWLTGALAYVKVREKMPGWGKFAPPPPSASTFTAAFLYTSHPPFALSGWC